MGEWQKYRLKELCSRLSSGKNISASNVSDQGLYPVYGGNGLRGYANISNFEGDCALIGRQGAYCGNVRYFSGRGYITEHAVVACGNDFVCTRFLAYLLSIQDLGRLSAQSAQPGLSVKQLGEEVFSLPPLPTQRKIAAVLSSLDDKIENNRKICANLEAQAQAIFKSWFVDFEPFGGKMPQGWKMGKLGDVAGLMRQTIAPNEMVEVVEHYSLPAYDEARYPAYDNSDNIKSNKFKVGKDSILVSKLNPAIKRLWDPFVDTETAVASTEFVVINPRDTRNLYFVYGVLDSPAYYAYAKSNVSGTTNSHQRISPEQILCFETVLPDEKWIEKFCDAVSPMYWGIKKRIKESRALAALRDALLPKLMSGEIDVEEDVA